LRQYQKRPRAIIQAEPRGCNQAKLRIESSCYTYVAEVIKLSELKGYWADIAARRQSLIEQQQHIQVRLDSIGQTVEHVEALLGSCERVRQKLRTFDAIEKRLVLEAQSIRVHGCRTHPWRLRGRF
jgi:hypothetical protein